MVGWEGLWWREELAVELGIQISLFEAAIETVRRHRDQFLLLNVEESSEPCVAFLILEMTHNFSLYKKGQMSTGSDI
jgi:hypothetical protein